MLSPFNQRQTSDNSMPKTATLTEVAERAGVSVITASRALRGQIHVAAATREKVLAAASELHYTPDVVAQTMRGTQSRLLGVFLLGFNSMVFHDLLVGIEAEALRVGYELVVVNVAIYDDGRTTGVEMMLKLCDGVIWLLPNGEHTLMHKLEAGALPSVLVGFCARPVKLPVIVGANYAGSHELVRHLIALGHRKIAFIGGASHTGQSRERQRAYEDALRGAGLPVRADYVVGGDYEVDSGHAQARRLLALSDRPTAIFCANDEMALGALKAAGELGLNVPADVSIAGYDDVPAASAVTPALTTVREPLGEIGMRAVDELVALIGGRARTPSRIELPTRLVVRASTGPAPR
jgi:LacI family transcriptional regulator